MNEVLYSIVTFIIGLLLGTLFFGGLWFTVKKAVTSKKPALWFVGSFLFRTGITLIGFYYTSLGNWQRLLICMLGFIIARLVITYLTKQNKETAIELKKEVSHEA
jgi:F1F0 ATPase subunit 2